MVTKSRKLALHGGVPTCENDWPIWPPVNESIQEHLLDALKSGRWAISGLATNTPPIQRQFEEEWANYCGSNHAIAVSSGSSALVLSLEALGIGPGDEVIVPVWTWVACATAVLRVGAIPILADVSENNFCIDANSIVPLITNKTKAVIVVHMQQSIADIYPILELCNKHNIFVIEDAAQAHGAIYDGRKVGSFGDIGTFSFQQSKVMTSGEGGAVITNDESLANRVFELHADGRRAINDAELNHQELTSGLGMMGSNHGMTEFQAAILRAQLFSLDERLEKAERNAKFLDEHIKQLGQFKMLNHPQLMERRTVFRYSLTFNKNITDQINLESLRCAISAETNINWHMGDPPLHNSPLFKPHKNPRYFHFVKSQSNYTKFPVADAYSSRTLTCPHSILLATRKKTETLCFAIEKVMCLLDRITLAD